MIGIAINLNITSKTIDTNKNKYLILLDLKAQVSNFSAKSLILEFNK